MVEVELVRIILRGNPKESQYVYLKEKGGERELPIVIGFCEAMEIQRKVSQTETPRPMTHDLLGAMMTQLGARLERVVITELREHTFYARLDLRRDGEAVHVDSRPSDAIPLAIQFAAPIFVEEEVLDQVAM